MVEREFTNYRLVEEHYAELPYRPRKSKKTYRMVVLRKRINVAKGQQHLEDEIRYFFYVTNVSARKLSAKKTIFQSNARCHQENLIEQLKNGVRAMQMPSGEFLANWAYMVIASQAWNLKIWLGLILPSSEKTRELLRMEYRRFVREVMTFAAQVVETGRYLVLRPLTHADSLDPSPAGRKRLVSSSTPKIRLSPAGQALSGAGVSRWPGEVCAGHKKMQLQHGILSAEGGRSSILSPRVRRISQNRAKGRG